MYIYSALFLILIIGYCVNHQTKLNNYHQFREFKRSVRAENRDIAIFSLLFVIIIGCRATSVGIDTFAYEIRFDTYQTTSISLSSLLSDEWYSEPGFHFFAIMLNKAGMSWNAFSVLAAIIYVIPIMRLIQQKSRDIYFSAIIFMLFGFFSFAMSGIRQSLAMGFCVMAYLALDKRRYLLFVVLTIIGIAFHKSALINFLLLPMSFIRFTRANAKIWVIVAAIVTASGYSFLRNLFIRFSVYLGKDYDIMNTGGLLTEMFFIITIVVCLYAAFQNKGFMQEDEYYVKCALLSAMILPIVAYNPALSRTYYYFSIFEIILIPNMIYSIRNPAYRFIGTIAYIAVGMWFFFPRLESSKLIPYLFFWQAG